MLDWLREKFTRQPIVQRYGIYGFLLLVLLLAALIAPSFYQTANIFNVLRQGSALGILTVGQTVVILGGGLDLSVAAIMQLSAVTAAEITGGGNQMVWAALLASLGMGAAVGLANGLIITRRNVSPFVATLFMGMFVTGLRMIVTGATPSGDLAPALTYLGGGSVGPVPSGLILFFLVAAGASFLFRQTTLGRRIYAVGGNDRTASLSGVDVDRVELLTYVLSGLLAAVAGLVLAGYLGYADQWLGEGYGLDSIAAAVVGGVVLGGGRGSVEGAVAGVLLMTVLLNIVLLLNLDKQYQLVVTGGVIILSIAFYSADWGRLFRR